MNEHVVYTSHIQTPSIGHTWTSHTQIKRQPSFLLDARLMDASPLSPSMNYHRRYFSSLGIVERKKIFKDTVCTMVDAILRPLVVSRVESNPFQIWSPLSRVRWESLSVVVSRDRVEGSEVEMKQLEVHRLSWGSAMDSEEDIKQWFAT